MTERTLAEDLAALAGRIAALALLALSAPALLALRWVAGTRLVSRVRVGQDGRTFHEMALAGIPDGTLARRFGAKRWPTLVNVLRGEMALVGPRARTPGELDLRDPRAQDVLRVRPGLVCSWWIFRRRGLDHGSELEADLAYVAKAGPLADAGLLARAAAAAFAGEGRADVSELRVLGVRTDAISMDDAVERIAAMASRGSGSQVCFANADCLNIACRDAAYRDTLEAARLVLPDGTGMRIASRMAGRTIRWDVNGTDLFVPLCRRLAVERRRVFLLGAKPGVAEKVAAWMLANHPGLEVAGVQHGYFTQAEEASVVERIRTSRTDVLLVAFGAPRQDVWIREHLPELHIHVALGVGGLFDFYSFSLPRAPMWMRELGLEWSFRLWQEPGRLWRRYLVGNVVFLTRVLLEASGVVDYTRAPALEEGVA